MFDEWWCGSWHCLDGGTSQKVRSWTQSSKLFEGIGQADVCVPLLGESALVHDCQYCDMSRTPNKSGDHLLFCASSAKHLSWMVFDRGTRTYLLFVCCLVAADRHLISRDIRDSTRSAIVEIVEHIWTPVNAGLFLIVVEQVCDPSTYQLPNFQYLIKNFVNDCWRDVQGSLDLGVDAMSIIRYHCLHMIDHFVCYNILRSSWTRTVFKGVSNTTKLTKPIGEGCETNCKVKEDFSQPLQVMLNKCIHICSARFLNFL